MRLWNIDRLLLEWLYRLYPSLLDAIVIVQPETVIRWHRRGFRAYWHWKSRHVCGRPRIDSEIRALIRRMSRENPLWGAPRIHGELLMLGIEVAESTVGRYMDSVQPILAAFVQWRSEITQQHHARPGRTATSSALSDLFGVTASILVVFDEAQFRRVLKNYASYYNQVRTHLSLDKNAPDFRRPQKLGRIAAIPILGGLQGHESATFLSFSFV